MTISPDQVEAPGFAPVDEWLRSLTPHERQLLAAHIDGSKLPCDVVALLRRGPLSPMEAPESGDGTAGGRRCHRLFVKRSKQDRLLTETSDHSSLAHGYRPIAGRWSDKLQTGAADIEPSKVDRRVLMSVIDIAERLVAQGRSPVTATRMQGALASSA